MKNTTRKIDILVVLLLMFQSKIEAVIDLGIDAADMIDLVAAGKLRQHFVNHSRYLEETIQHMDNWASKKVANITQSKELDLTTYKNIEKLVNTIQNNITELSLELLKNNDNINDLRNRYSILRNDLEILDRDLNNNTRKSVQLLGEYLGDKSEIISKSDRFSEQMGILLEQIKKKETLPPTDVIKEAIRRKEYFKIVHLLNELKDEHEIYDIIKIIYNGTGENVDLVLNIGNKIENVTHAFILYKDLNDELDVNDKNIDCNKIIRFIKTCKKAIAQLPDEPSLKMEAKYLIINLENKLRMSVTKYLKETLLNFNNEFSLENSCFCSIFEFNDELLPTICQEVISELNTNVSNQLNYVGNFKFILDKVIDMYVQNDKYDLKLAFFIKNLKTINDNQYKEMIEDEIRNLKNRLPNFVKNLVFAEKICIKNRGLNEYLRLSEEKFDDDKFTVQTKKIDEENLTLNDAWRIERYKELIFYIKNVAKDNSDLYIDINMSENSFYDSTEGRSVYLIAGNDSHRDAIWQIDHSSCPDGCFIKNSAVIHNLYATKDTNHFPYVGSIDINNADYWLWDFIDCSHIIN